MKKRAIALRAVPSETPKVLPARQQHTYMDKPRTVEETLCEAYQLLAIVDYWFEGKDRTVPYDDEATWNGIQEILTRAMRNVKAASDALPYAASEIRPWKAGAR